MEVKTYPGIECGLSEDEWQLEQIVDKIRSKDTPTLEAIGILRRLASSTGQGASTDVRGVGMQWSDFIFQLSIYLGVRLDPEKRPMTFTANDLVENFIKPFFLKSAPSVNKEGLEDIVSKLADRLGAMNPYKDNMGIKENGLKQGWNEAVTTLRIILRDKGKEEGK